MEDGIECPGCGGKRTITKSGLWCFSCSAEADADAHRDRDIIRDNENRKYKKLD